MAIEKKFTPKELDNYFKGSIKGYFHEKCIEKYKNFLPHSDGEYPAEIIDKQRPNEPDIIKTFRKDIWKPITKPSFTKVMSSLSKIRRSSDWGIKYPKEEFPLIKEDNKLNVYCEEKFPLFTSITNWVFSVMLKQYLIDSNGVVVVLPLRTDIEPTEYIQPFPYIYNSCDVVYFEPEVAAIINIPAGCFYTTRRGDTKIGKSFYVITTMVIDRWDQVDDKGNMKIMWSYNHGLDYLPVFKLGGVICDSQNSDYLYESRICGLLPGLDEAVAEYTDLQAGKRLHIYPERWEYTQHECPKCKGTGTVINKNYKTGDDISSQRTKCDNCHNGFIPSGPFSKTIIRPADVGQQAIPTPPAGYILKDIEIIRLMQESYKAHIYDALASINFQFLEQVPLNESGKAKEVDKEELNNTVHSIAEDLVACMDKIYKSIAYFRYGGLYAKEEINEMLPNIAVPEHYDLLSSEYMQQEIKTAREAKINSLLISEMEVEYGARRFPQNDDINDIIKLVNKLDPLPGNTIDEKMAMVAGGTVTKENAIISNNLISFLKRAIDENEDFMEMDMQKQKEILVAFAKEQIDAQKEEMMPPETEEEGELAEEGEEIEQEQEQELQPNGGF